MLWCFSLQMVEHGGFYRTSDQTWVKLERIQFVGACNPPTDPGRKPLTHRCGNQNDSNNNIADATINRKTNEIRMILLKSNVPYGSPNGGHVCRL